MNLDPKTKWALIGLAAAIAFSLIALRFLEARDRQARCIEALRSEHVGDLVRHLECSQ